MENRFVTWLEIDLSAIEDNVRRLCALTGTPLMAVVKANGYGHGASQVARAAASGGAAWLGVARLAEALELRAAGLRLPILILGVVSVAEVEAAVAAEVALTVPSVELARAYGQRATALGMQARIHLKVDSGMGRLGVLPNEALAVVHEVQRNTALRLEGLFTHLARADEHDPAPTRAQLTAFQSVVDGLSEEGRPLPILHAANSVAALNFPESRMGLVRVGIAMYGLHPSAEAPLPEGFRPALTWKAQLASCKELPKGHGVSYGHEYVTRGREIIGAIPLGYADGFRRARPNTVLIKGARVPVVGRVCMDQCMVRLPAPLPLGTEVVLIGRQGSQVISAEEVAVRWDTNNYEVVTGLSARVPRLYTGER
jgi:alanine racemase